MKALPHTPGILVGHASDYDGLTGCAVVLCERGAVAGGDIRGSATGVDEWDVLSPMHVAPMIHGVVFSGGSAFGLESASGVRRFLDHKGVGFKTGAGTVPIVVGAILFDLGFAKKGGRPPGEMADSGRA